MIESVTKSRKFPFRNKVNNNSNIPANDKKIKHQLKGHGLNYSLKSFLQF